MRPLLYLLLCSAFWCNAQPGIDSLSTKILQPADMQADFRYLRRLLKETHPGLYRYMPKTQMQAKLDSLDRSLSQPLPFYSFFKIVAGLMADIRCAHTHALPQKKWREQFSTVQKTIPFFMFPMQGRLYVVFNGTDNQAIKPGVELLSINGQPMEAIWQQMYRYHWTDGYIQSSKGQLRGQLFALFYYWFIGQPNTFSLTFRDLNDDTLRYEIPARPFSAWWKTVQKNSVNKQMLAWYNRTKPKHPWRLSFPDTLANTAYLRIDGFGGKGQNSNEQAVMAFQKFMNKSLAKIGQKKVQHLVIDLRGNSGGWDSQGIELFTYLMKGDTAVPYYARQHSITDGSTGAEFIKFSDLSEADRANIKNELIPEPDGTFRLKQGSDTREPKRYAPKPNRFRGQVYILMDGQSVSTAAEFLAVAHANKVGVFIGEESGGAYEGGNGSSYITLELPKSGVQVHTPLVYYRNAVPEAIQKGRGTIPDHYVPLQRSDLLTNSSPQLRFAARLIRSASKP